MPAPEEQEPVAPIAEEAREQAKKGVETREEIERRESQGAQWRTVPPPVAPRAD